MRTDGWSFKLLDDLLREAGEKLAAIAERGGQVIDASNAEDLERVHLRLFTIRRNAQTISDRAIAAMPRREGHERVNDVGRVPEDK